MAQTYSSEFQEEVCKRVQTGVTAAQVAREPCINVNTLYTWMTHFKKNPHDSFVGSMSRKGNCWDNTPWKVSGEN